MNHVLAVKAGFGSLTNYHHFEQIVGASNALRIANEIAYRYNDYKNNEFAKTMFNKIRTYYRYSTHKYPSPLTEKQKDALIRVVNYVYRYRYYDQCAAYAHYNRVMYSEHYRLKRQELAWELRNE